MGPFAVIGNFVHGQQWAHSQPLTTFLMDDNGPIRSHRQLCLLAAMGPFVAIGNFHHGQQWAHLQSSTTFLMGDNGPICSHRQLFSWVIMGPFGALDDFSHWVIMGPFAVIGNFVRGQQWAHLQLSAIFIMGSNGPIWSP